MKEFFQKIKGTSPPPPKIGRGDMLSGVLGSAVAFLLIGVLHVLFKEATSLPLLMASFGASAALVFGAPKSPLAQPRNVILGHAISALIGVTIYKLVGGNDIAGICLAVPLAIGLMNLTGTFHPPGGATAFMAVAGGEGIHSLGYWFVLSPCIAGSILMILIALVVNNIPSRQRYPLFW
jgi:CBS-domain-containing membrane protein